MDQPVCRKCGCAIPGVFVDIGEGPMCSECYDADLKRRNDLGAQNELLVSALRAAREVIERETDHDSCYPPYGPDVKRHPGCSYDNCTKCEVLAQIDAALEGAE